MNLNINPFIVIFDLFKYFLENSYNILKSIFTPLLDLIPNQPLRLALSVILKPFGLNNLSIMNIITTGIFIILIMKFVKHFKL